MRQSTNSVVRMSLAGTIHSEWLRLRRSILIPMHLIIAVAVGLCAGLYFAFSPQWNSVLAGDAFLQLLGQASILLISLSTGFSIEPERDVGGYATLLGVPSRRLAFAGRVLVLCALELAAAAIATGIFFVTLRLAGRAVPPVWALTAAVVGIVWGGIFMVIVLIWTTLRFGRNLTIGIGLVGFLIAIASQGGVANNLVSGRLTADTTAGFSLWLPVVWPAMFASTPVEITIASQIPGGSAQSGSLSNLYIRLMIISTIATLMLAAIALARLNRFEDNRQGGS